MKCCVSLALLPAFIAAAASDAGAQTEFDRANAAVVRLAPAQLSGTPARLQRDLERRGCRIPQPSRLLADSTRTHNVIRGSFTGPGLNQWAVLCSIRDSSRILVYVDSTFTAVDSVAHAADAGFLQQIDRGQIGYSRAISSVGAAEMRRMYARTPRSPTTVALPADANHAGITDAFLDKGSNIHYFHLNRWLLLPGAD
jgi:hypothetical protein